MGGIFKPGDYVVCVSKEFGKAIYRSVDVGKVYRILQEEPSAPGRYFIDNGNPYFLYPAEIFRLKQRIETAEIEI